MVQAVCNEQGSGISYATLRVANERLRAENEALWQAWTKTEALSEAKQREWASANCAIGLSVTQIVTVLAIVLPSGAGPSRATVGRWVQQASERSSRLLGMLDIASWLMRNARGPLASSLGNSAKLTLYGLMHLWRIGQYSDTKPKNQTLRCERQDG